MAWCPGEKVVLMPNIQEFTLLCPIFAAGLTTQYLAITAGVLLSIKTHSDLELGTCR